MYLLFCRLLLIDNFNFPAPEICTLSYFNSNVKMFPHTSGHSRLKNAYLSISFEVELKFDKFPGMGKLKISINNNLQNSKHMNKDFYFSLNYVKDL